jgi:hypothetical protein
MNIGTARMMMTAIYAKTPNPRPVLPLMRKPTLGMNAARK